MHFENSFSWKKANKFDKNCITEQKGLKKPKLN